MKYARQFSHEKLADVFSSETLFRMSTSIPAQIAHVDGKVGSLAKGLYADLFVLTGDRSDPYAALAATKLQDVQLVLVGGVPGYGSEALMKALAVKTEALEVCGATMYMNSAALPAGPFGAFVARLAADVKPYGSIKELGPIVECAK